jgi:hypothetical protein
MALGALVTEFEFEFTRARDCVRVGKADDDALHVDLHGCDPSNKELGPLGTLSDPFASL